MNLQDANKSSLYITTVRPPTEPYEFWKARRRIQQKELEQYLAGRFIWSSHILVNKGTKAIPKLEKVKLQGTYRKPDESAL
jgi:hypothetical protein